MTSLDPPCGLCIPATSRPARFSLRMAVAVWHQRRALACMDDARLDDLGLTREAAMKEARRRFWDLPVRGRE